MENTWQSDLKTQEMALSGISQLPITMPPGPLEPCAFGKMVTFFFFPELAPVDHGYYNVFRKYKSFQVQLLDNI